MQAFSSADEFGLHSFSSTVTAQFPENQPYFVETVPFIQNLAHFECFR